MNTKVTYDKQELDSIIADTKMAQYSDVFERHVWARAAKVAVEEVERLRAENDRLKDELSQWEEDSAVLPEDKSITETVNALRAENEALREACRVAEQTLRNFANGDLKGDAKVIAHNAAFRLFNLLQD